METKNENHIKTQVFVTIGCGIHSLFHQLLLCARELLMELIVGHKVNHTQKTNEVTENNSKY